MEKVEGEVAGLGLSDISSGDDSSNPACETRLFGDIGKLHHMTFDVTLWHGPNEN